MKPNTKNTIFFTISIAIIAASLYTAFTSATYYLEVYKAIYGIKVKVIEVSYRVEEEKARGIVNIVISVDNPSENWVEIVSGQGKVYLNGKYLGSAIIYAGEGIQLAPKTENFTLTGIALVQQAYFKLLEKAIEEKELSWFIEFWIQFRIGIHRTVIKTTANIRTKT